MFHERRNDFANIGWSGGMHHWRAAEPVLEPTADIMGTPGNDLLIGTESDDLINAILGGSDTVYAYGGNDYIAFGQYFDLTDHIHGGDGFDTMQLQGSHTIMLSGDNIEGIEKILLLSRQETVSYNFTVSDSLLAAGGSLTIDGGYLTSNDHLSFDGSAETDGSFSIHAGNTGNPQTGVGTTLIGGGGDDYLYGSDGNDLIDGRGGRNRLFGNYGNDHLIVGSAGNFTYVDGGGGTDTLTISGDLRLPVLNSVEIIEFQSGASLTLNANQFVTSWLVSGSGTIIVNMSASTSELYLQQFVGSAGVAITVNGTANDDVVKGGLGSANAINGGDGYDFLRGGQLVDNISGGAGDDKVTGIGGGDTLTGGAGSDQFRYFSMSDSTVGAGADHITDFVAGTDFLDFRVFDTDPNTAGYQTPAYIGSAAFANTGTAQIHWVTSGANILVEVDIDGNGAADMQIVLDNAAGQTLTSGDFLL